MKSILPRRFMPFSALLLLSVISCNKNENPVTPVSQQQTDNLLMSVTNTVADAAGIESQDLLDAVAGDSSMDCRVITFDTSKNIYPHIRTIDFGSGCTGTDGITRKGKKITTVYVNEMKASPGTLISETTYENFYADNINITGTVMLYVDSSSTADTLMLKCVANRTLTGPNGDIKTVNTTNYWKRISGADTPVRMDDVYQVTGSSYGAETLDGATEITWNSQIDTNHPVIKPVDCDHRTQGIINVQLQIVTGGSSNFTEQLDYGNGACDNIATLSINGGNPVQITLPMYFWPLSL